MLVNRMTNTLIIHRFNINYEMHIMFNSHQFTLYLVSHASRLGTFLITTVFHPHALFQLFSHTSLSFVLSSAMKYIKHSDHTTPQLYAYSRHTRPSIQTLCIFILFGRTEQNEYT